MTITEFRRAVEQFHEHLYQAMPDPMRVMRIIDRAKGVTVVLSCQKVEEGLALLWERVVRIPEEKLDIGLGVLVDGLISLANYQNLSVEEGYGLPFDYTICNFEIEDKWYINFGNGVKIPSHRLRITESRTTRILAQLKTPLPEWRVAPAYPEKLNGVYGWDARWAEAHAERAARAAFKMLAASYGRLNVKSGKGAVQLTGRGYESPLDHNSQEWPQCEL